MLKYVMAVIFISALVYAQEAEGRIAPNFLLEDVDGYEIELSQELGEGPVLLSFWATWCKPCIEELGHYQHIYNEYKEKGFKMFAIAVDDERSVSKVNPFVKSKGFNFSVLYDTNSDVAREYYARTVPYSILIDKNGKIVYSHLGYKKGDELILEKLIKNLLTPGSEEN